MRIVLLCCLFLACAASKPEYTIQEEIRDCTRDNEALIENLIQMQIERDNYKAKCEVYELKYVPKKGIRWQSKKAD
jgi:hypothetical protein